MPPIVVGGLYLVADQKVDLLPAKQRTLHQERRRFVVLSGNDTNSDPEWPSVLGAPLSSSTRYKTPFDVALAAGEAGAKKKCWIRIPALQPLQKSDLEDFTGELGKERLAEAQVRVFQYMGMVDAPAIDGTRPNVRART